ncbi:MAG: fumarate hydratase C-terminal domain-containing protein [Veillonella sp.]|nr:fumarate hydratase C-terminal domain-containing protein [Veillonella sp.]
MAETIRINTEEYNEEFSRKLKVGDSVLITGKIYSARDAAHKVMTEALARGEKLPIDWTNKFVYYLGPTPAKPGDPIGSAGPTTSGRMDAYTPTMLDQGIKGMIGKGSRKPAAALIAKSIKKYEVLAYGELGPEALAELTVEDFPCIVVGDTEGNNFYEQGQKPYRKI